MQEEQGRPFIRGLIPKNLKCRLSITFNDQLQQKKLKYGVEFVFCPDSSQFDEEDWSSNWKDYTNQEKFEDAAQILRREIVSSRPVFSSWPPREKEIDSERMVIPKSLEHFLDILYATEKKKCFDVKDISNHMHKTLIVQMKPKKQ